MKKFISALTSVCIAATSLVGATMTTVTAAGELEFTFKERSTSSTTFNISAADLAAGDVTVDCDVIITNYVPTYGFGLKMDFENTDTNTIYDASTAENPYFAFTEKTQFDKTGPFTDVWGVEDGTYEPQPGLSATKIANYSMMNFVWRTAATLDDDSTPTNAYFIPGTTNPLLNISFTVASDTPAGTYILDIKTEPYTNTTGGAVSTGQSKINNVDGEVVPFKTVPLTIVVGDAETTTTTTAATTTKAPATTTKAPATTKAPTTTTKSESPVDGIVYEIATVEGEAGADVDVPITIKGDTGTAGMVLELSADSNLKLKRRLNGDAYEGAPTWNKDTLTYVWNAGDGRNLVAADGSTLTTLRFTVPADAQPGDEFPISFRGAESKIIDQEGVELNITYVDGMIKIPGEATTTTAAPATTTKAPDTTKAPTTTTKSETPVDGIVYEIATVEGEAGADVDVPITIKGDTGTAGMVLELSADSNLKLKRRLNGDAYEGAPTWNKDTLTYVWNAGDGRNLVAADGSTLTTLRFTVPADAQPGDEFPISFRGAESKIIDQEGVELNITYVDGKIVIPGTATTTKAPATTTSEAPATTTSTQTTTTAPVGTVLYGDTNADGRVSIADAVLLNKYLAGKAEMTEQGKINADCDKHSTELNLDDTTMILKFLAQLIKQSDLGAEVA